ncbi:MAG: hypothetical protein M1480_02955 [Bacteroidetes bacterium]|nr:hypothetical protein [Bacteroidota bacterium]
MSLIEKISQLGFDYRRKFLTADRESICNYWWSGFDFFLNKAFYQGRLDSVSAQVYEIAIKILREYFTNDNNQRLVYRHNNNWYDLKQQLDENIGKGKIGKGRDVVMVISALDFIDSIEENNIVKYSINKILNNNLKEIYTELQNSKCEKGIVQVGPKIAPFFLRDIVTLFELEDKIHGNDFIYLQPIDTWLRKIAKKINLVEQDAKDEIIINKIIEECNSANISPILFNQGAWYLGNNAFNILLDKIISDDVG